MLVEELVAEANDLNNGAGALRIPAYNRAILLAPPLRMVENGPRRMRPHSLRSTARGAVICSPRAQPT